ncbi:hypothetical protein FZEAL_10012 [Fusarium zealandicum]|uniref:DUF7726 domain-containing protein n=1 Tax=Fusarium zealandicum TaxID=1053134 RepID=A0A8H4U655_9HYPO|nr:hypothetical protein FZEAL_10012 [Fusarium zealandicum]
MLRPSPPPKAKAPGKTATAGHKRKAEMSLDEEIAAYKQDLDDVVSPDSFESDTIPSCGTIRSKINKLIDSGIMTKTDFCKAIGANSNSLNSFLRKKGPFGGSGSSVWHNAYAWFQQRQVMKLKMPDVKKRQLEQHKKDAAEAAASSSSSTAQATSPASAKKAKTAATGAALPDISGIELYGEETDKVPVFDTCDEVRHKINAHLKTPGLTQAQFCRDIYAQLHQPKCKGIQSKQLSDFRGMKGPLAGAKSTVFYAAYVYFEKLRIAQDKPKTEHREDMEDIYPTGMRREVDHRTMFLTSAANQGIMDQYGRIF